MLAELASSSSTISHASIAFSKNISAVIPDYILLADASSSCSAAKNAYFLLVANLTSNLLNLMTNSGLLPAGKIDNS